MTHITTTQEASEWQPYHLDHYAQELVIANRDKENVLNESHKMRMAVAYGLERFWGEHLRLMRENKGKGEYWKDVWKKLAKILEDAGITLPNDEVQPQETQKIKEMTQKIWNMPISDQRVALMVLTQFCDALVWWTQRYKRKNQQNGDD